MITALFDGYCVICQATRRVIKALDWFNRVEFLDLHQHDLVRQRYPQFDHSAMMGEIHVVTPDGDVYAGFKGTRRLLQAVPLGWPLGLLLHLPGMTWLGQKIYRAIARNRYGINRLLGVDLAACEDGACKIPQ